jgi:hypothetical protein
MEVIIVPSFLVYMEAIHSIFAQMDTFLNFIFCWHYNVQCLVVELDVYVVDEILLMGFVHPMLKLKSVAVINNTVVILAQPQWSIIQLI